MAPAENVNITQQQRDDNKYNHKKFQGKRVYAHKKFGACISSTPPKTANKRKNNSLKATKAAKESSDQTNTNVTAATKRSTADIFRPYALPDKTPRKRKYHELQNEQQTNSQDFAMDYKRFAYTALTPAAATTSLPAFSTSTSTHLINPISTLIYNPFYRLQQYQFNPQIFSLILQKQRAALCMGEILKRQANLNLYNFMG